MRLTLLSLLPLVLCGALAAQGGSTLRDFKRTFYLAPGQPADAATCKQALDGLAGQDGKAVAKALVEAAVTAHNAVVTLDAERAEYNAELARLRKGKEFEAKPSFPKPTFNRIKELQRLAAENRARVDGLRQVEVAATTRLTGLRDPDALEWMLKSVLTNKRYPLFLRMTAARAAGSSAEELMPALMRSLKKAKKREQIVAVLDGIGRAGKMGRDATERILPLLEHKDALVRERAALALAKLAVPDAIAPMIALLERESGSQQKRVATALEILTRQQHGTVVGAWKAWWAAEKAGYLSGERPLGGGDPSINKEVAKNYYMGIPQDGESILYVIDCSGSMKTEVDFTLPGATRQSGVSRLEACKAELSRALGQLSPEKKFNIIWYADLPHRWKDSVVPANARNVAEAQEWLKPLQPNSSNNIHDAMQMAFAGMGRDAPRRSYKSKPVEIDLDTIFLLTDGSPTTPEGKPDSTDAIIEAVREWNALKLVAIHCIGIGKDLNTTFLEQLARENGGQFKKY